MHSAAAVGVELYTDLGLEYFETIENMVESLRKFRPALPTEWSLDGLAPFVAGMFWLYFIEAAKLIALRDTHPRLHECPLPQLRGLTDLQEELQKLADAYPEVIPLPTSRLRSLWHDECLLNGYSFTNDILRFWGNDLWALRT